MNFRKTMLLAGVLAAVIAVIIWVVMPREERASKRGLIFSDLRAEEIKSITVERSGQRVVLENIKPRAIGAEAGEGVSTAEPASWQLGGVPGAELDFAAINSIVTALNGLKLDTPLPPEDTESDLTLYGLKDGEMRIDITTVHGRHTLIFGKLNEYVSQRYLKLADSSEIYIVPPTVFSAADKKADDLRDRTPLDFADSEVRAIELRSPGETARVEHDAGGDWRLVKPIAATGSAGALAEVMRQLRNLRAETFIDDGATKRSRYNLEKPLYSVRLEFTEASKRQPIDLTFGAVKDSSAKDPLKDKSSKAVKSGSKTDAGESGKVSKKFYFTISGKPAVFEAASDPVAMIFKVPDDLREKQLFRFSTDDTVKLVAERDAQPYLTLEKQDEQWRVNGNKADQTFVTQLLHDLALLEASRFPQESVAGAAGFDKPSLKLTITLVDPGSRQRSEKTLLIGAAAKRSDGTAEWFAAAGDLREPFFITEGSLKRVTPREETLKPVPLPTAPVEPTKPAAAG